MVITNSGYENIFNALSKLYSRGIDIHYVLGNHDFWDLVILTINLVQNYTDKILSLKLKTKEF